MEERRERDPDTGEMIYSNIEGSGLGDMFSKLVSKLTGETASKLANRAAEKLVEKGAEKIGEKTGELIGEKIYDKFSSKGKKSKKVEKETIPQETIPQEPIYTEETKGKDISQILKKQGLPKEDKHQYVKDIYNSLI